MAQFLQKLISELSAVKPPATSLPARGTKRAREPEQLIAINEQCDVFILGEGNRLHHANLNASSDATAAAATAAATAPRNSFSSSSYSTPQQQQQQQQQYRELVSEVVFQPREDAAGNLMAAAKVPAELKIRAIEFSPTGDCLLVWGDYFAGVVQWTVTGKRHYSSGSSSSSSAQRKPRYEFTLLDLTTTVVDEMRMRIADAKWHPLSDTGCVTLLAVKNTVDNGARQEGTQHSSAVLLLYSVAQCNEQQLAKSRGTVLYGEDPPDDLYRMQQQQGLQPEQEFYVTQYTGGASVDDYDDDAAVAIAYCGEQGWDRFAVCVMRASGDITVLCPVLPSDAALLKCDLVSL
jgi:hypothetical protein